MVNIKNVISGPNAFAGEYTYCADIKEAEKFEEAMLY